LTWSGIEQLQVRVELADKRKAVGVVDVKFIGILRDDQERAFEALLCSRCAKTNTG